MSPRDKPLVWLRGEVKTPPFGANARLEAGFLLRHLQRGAVLGLPHSRPMPSVAPGCHELRIVDGDLNWRIMYYIATDAVVILDVFPKKTETTPKSVLDHCRRRLAGFLKLTQPRKGGSRASR
ncbi:MAG TPA: type II toxin-antitoxin system RelE/ParE family toxin [Vicinamibacterales bacterium]|nr:type II toxin-antitoxin system RelE/ParE family toxin [Vicinamibacterales bacterium]